MEEEKKNDKELIKKVAITAGIISCSLFLAYRFGVKKGYKDAMGTIEGTMDCLVDAFTKF